MTAWLTLAAAAQLAVAAPPGPRPRVDPALPEKLRAVVASAVDAELDPKRGPGNAMAIIDKAQAETRAGTTEYAALQLRKAAIGLRRIFLTRSEFPVPLRYEQALSTFSRLDVTDPGLERWIERTCDHHERARAQICPRAQRRIDVAVLLRGAELKRPEVERILRRTLAAAGFGLRFVPVKAAPFVITLASEGAKSPRPDQRAVRVTLGVEHIHEGEVEWRTSVFRTATAPTPNEALTANLGWLARIGGRDLVFRWMGIQGLATLVGEGPLSLRSREHAH